MPSRRLPSASHDVPAQTAPGLSSLSALDAAVATCRACPRLVACREAARVKVRAFRVWKYWARPVAGFGPPEAPLTIVGLAPAAHGGNRTRTGRIFTGDPSGDAPPAARYDVGPASQPTATHRGDGLELYGVRIPVPVRFAPPDNRPTTTERDTCCLWLALDTLADQQVAKLENRVRGGCHRPDPLTQRNEGPQDS